MTQHKALGLPGPTYFVLASSSPRRRELLAAFEIPFTVLAPDTLPDIAAVDESPQPNEAPAALTQRLSETKTRVVTGYLLRQAAAKPWPAALAARVVVVAADTVVVAGGQILGKPAGPEQAVDMLRLLRDRPHTVYSGLTVARLPADKGGSLKLVTRLQRSKIWMRPYSNAEIAAYVATGSPLDKAGAYGIQDGAFAPVERLEGCFASVMGFPLGELGAAVRELGLFLPQVGLICGQQTGRLCCQATPCGF